MVKSVKVLPYPVEEKDGCLVVTFPEFADELRTPEHHAYLRHARASVLVFDLTQCRIADVQWLALITALSRDAQGTLVAVVGANEETKRTADFLGYRKHWHEYETLSEVQPNVRK